MPVCTPYPPGFGGYVIDYTVDVGTPKLSVSTVPSTILSATDNKSLHDLVEHMSKASRCDDGKRRVVTQKVCGVS
jgi:hypothetical protein